jgi:hypothetical protein
MTSRADLYRVASDIIERYGPDAGEYAEDMLRRRLEDDDIRQAGVWLAIGNAIEDLSRLAAGETVH